MSVSFGNLSEKSPRIFDVILAPLITEKATLAAEQGQYTFKVAPHATKQDIKTAIQALYAVKVKKVNTLNTAGKVKRFKGQKGKRPDVRKAIVCLEKGQTINLGMES